MNIVEDPRIKQLIIRIIAIIFFMEILDAGVLNTSLPQIAKSLHHNPIDLKAAVTTYLLTLGIFIPVSAWCADYIGEKKTLIMAIAVFALGSIGCAFSVNLSMLICFRLLQGVGGGFLMPVARLILVRFFGVHNTVDAMAKVGAIMIYAMMLGPFIGGAITTYIGWRYIFFVNVPLGLFAIYYLYRYLPVFGELKKEPFDFRGFLFIGTALGATLFFLDIIVHPHFSVASKLFLLTASIAAFFLYVWHEKRVKFPIINREIFDDTSFNWISLGSFTTRLSLSALPFLVPLLLQAVYGLEAVQSGLFMIPSGIGAYLARRQVARLLTRVGYRKVMLYNATFVTCLFMSYVFQAYTFMPYLLVIQQFLFGASFAIQMSSMNSCAYRYMHEPFVGKASSFYSAVIQLSASFGVALAALTMVSVIGHADLTHNVPPIAFKVAFIVQGLYGFLAIYAFAKIKPE